MIKFYGIIVLVCLLLLSSCGHEHTWEDANCKSPKTCSECAETEGEALGHTWVDATCTEPKTCSECSTTEGEALGHTWINATCIEPKTCSVCSTTEGEALGHQWKDATCTKPKTCSNCSATEGETLEHSWNDATCTKPKTCSTCSKTDGSSLGHIGGLIVEEHDYSSVCYYEKQYCTVCNVQMKSDMIFYSKMHENGLFLFSPNEFTEKLGSFYSVLKSDMTTTIAVLDDNTLGCGIVYKSKCIGVIMFNDNNTYMEGDDKDSHTMSSMMVKYFTNDISVILDSMFGIMYSCQPHLEEDDAKQLAKEIVLASADSSYYEYKGIKYFLGSKNNEYWFIVSVLNK